MEEINPRDMVIGKEYYIEHKNHNWRGKQIGTLRHKTYLRNGAPNLIFENIRNIQPGELGNITNQNNERKSIDYIFYIPKRDELTNKSIYRQAFADTIDTGTGTNIGSSIAYSKDNNYFGGKKRTNKKMSKKRKRTMRNRKTKKGKRKHLF
jgi:hypothetical protein